MGPGPSPSQAALMRVVVDASVLIAALMADGSTRHALTHTTARFHAPAYIMQEIQRHQTKIARRAGMSAATFEAVCRDLFDRIEMIPDIAYATAMEDARAACRRAAAEGEQAYVALA